MKILMATTDYDCASLALGVKNPLIVGSANLTQDISAKPKYMAIALVRSLSA